MIARRVRTALLLAILLPMGTANALLASWCMHEQHEGQSSHVHELTTNSPRPPEHCVPALSGGEPCTDGDLLLLAATVPQVAALPVLLSGTDPVLRELFLAPASLGRELDTPPPRT